MKKMLAVLLALVLTVSCFSVTAAAQERSLSVQVSVTVAVEGTLALTQKTVTVTDSDADGKLTICDALYAAHETAYEGGAAAGYATAQTQYGLSMVKLWGNESGNFGYYLNNASAWSLVDAVKDGDAVYAYVYADGSSFSDMYTYFDKSSVTAETKGEITLTLSGASFDAQWNPVTVPVEGAVITVNGEKTTFKTDKDGKVTVVLETAGTVVLSAVSETQTLVPPTCIATVEAAPEEKPEEEAKPVPEEKPVPEKVPQTGETGSGAVVLLCAALLLMGVCKKSYAK